MPSSNILKSCKIKKTFRNDLVKSAFDFNENIIKESFTYNFDLPNEWNIGIIYGNSGTGKTTIAKELFENDIYQEHEFSNDSVIDEMPKNKDYETIVNTFVSVGFGSVPSWLKPYHVLSNGEKMRVQLAYMLLSEKEINVFDEFTSVVDRNVAKVLSFAISKTIKKTNKKFVAISCHSDILEWLEPDWSFCTDTMQFKRELLRRPKFEFTIMEGNIKAWDYFKKYHYLNHNISGCIKYMIAFYQNNPIGFISASNFPHPKVKNIAKLNRIVIIPDYQGIGIANQLIDAMTSWLLTQKKRIRITFSHYASYKMMIKRKDFILVHSGRMIDNPNSSLQMCKSSNRKTYTFEYKGCF